MPGDAMSQSETSTRQETELRLDALKAEIASLHTRDLSPETRWNQLRRLLSELSELSKQDR